jgi:hypothetical protein
MRRRVLFFVLAVGVTAGSVLAATYAFMPATVQRKMKVVRDYELAITPRQVNVAEIPAMISFQGATNEQVIKSSEFVYSVKPDKIEIASDELGGLPRKYYKLTWNNPGVDKIQVAETMIVLLAIRNRLPTSAKLPYPKAVRTTYASYLEGDKDGKIDPNNPEFKKANNTIRKNAYAEDVVEAVCDWINGTVKYDAKSRYGSNSILKDKKGDSYSQSKLACVMIRRLGIPCDIVHNKFIGKENGHYCIEVYYPDTGWVFYEICHRQRGFRDISYLIGTGRAYRVQAGGKGMKWVNGFFCKEEDMVEYKKAVKDPNTVIRSTPRASTLGVTVTHTPVPPKMEVRQEPIRELILNLSYPPGEEKLKVKEQKKQNPRASGRMR